MQDAKRIIEKLKSKDGFDFEDMCNLVRVLRSEDGCPWDREQTNKSIRNEFIDETYEFIEGLDTDDDTLMCEELGDVLFQIVFHTVIKEETDTFDMGDVISGICRKMILRHPHVFGETEVDNSAQVLVNWENIKNDEKHRSTPYSQLDSVSKALPSLMRCQKLIKKADKTGLDKMGTTDEYIQRLEEAISMYKKSGDTALLGKMMFAVCGIAKTQDVEAEELLYRENNSYLDSFKID